jgi:hypothetical protein
MIGQKHLPTGHLYLHKLDRLFFLSSLPRASWGRELERGELIRSCQSQRGVAKCRWSGWISTPPAVSFNFSLWKLSCELLTTM